MEKEYCPRICVAVMLGSLLLYFPFEHLVPGWLHLLSGFFLLCSMAVFLAWCSACYVGGRRHRG